MLTRIAGRTLLCLVALGVAAAAWAGPSLTMTITKLEPAGPYKPGQQIAVEGYLDYYVQRPWGGGGILTTRTRHQASLAVDFIRAPDDDWPELPEMQSAVGKLYFLGGPTGLVPFERKHGASITVWQTDINPPSFTRGQNPMHRGRVDFKATFQLPQQCVAARLRGELAHCVGANWFVTYYYYDFAPLDLEVPGLKTVALTCSRVPYQTVRSQVVVSEDASAVTISGRVIDRTTQKGVARARVTATLGQSKQQALTDRRGLYTLTLSTSGTGAAATKKCDFRMESEAPVYVINYRVTVAGYKTREGKILCRYPADVGTAWFEGYLADKELLGKTKQLRSWLTLDGTVEFWTSQSRCTAKTISGWFTAYAVLSRAEGANRDVHYKKVILALERDTTQQQAAQPQTGAQDTTSVWDQRLKKLYEDAAKNNPKLVKLWEQMGWLVAAKKDWDDMLAGKKPTNMEQYKKRMQTNAGKIANVLWTMKETMLMLPGLSTASTVEEWAQKTKKAYKQLTGKDLLPSGSGESAWKTFAVNVGQHLQDLKTAGATQ